MSKHEHQHVYYEPEEVLHVTSGLDCPCVPELFAPCDECEESTGGSEGCWKCQGDGMLFLPAGYEGPFIVVHGMLGKMLEPYEGGEPRPWLATMKVLALVLAVLWLSACVPPVPPCPGCLPTSTPTPVSTPDVKPTPQPTVTPTPGSIPAGALAPLTSGRAVLEVDLSGFTGAKGIDTFALATFCFQDPHAPVPKAKRPQTPCIQVGLRGTDPSPCLLKPCQGKVALELRYSANIRFDGTITDESKMCGSGTRPGQWVPLGPGPVVTITLEWAPGFVRGTTPAGSAELHQGAAVGSPPRSSALPAFGWWCEGIPKGGIGYAYLEIWTGQHWGASVKLRSWTGTTGGALGVCP